MKRIRGHPENGDILVTDSDEICQLCRRSDDCPNKFGEKITVKSHKLTVHYFCLLMSSGVYQRGEENEGVHGFLVDDIKKEINRSSRLKCSGCKKTGASLGCFIKTCKQVAHFPCAVQQEFISQFTGAFPSYCRKHRPTQTTATSPNMPLSCSVCLEPIEPVLSYSVLKCPACHGSWFHRDCVQVQANNAALFFFRCTICNNKEQFQQEMLRMGIHIPERDASWELEENAYDELLQVYQQCDAEKCHCTSGRQYSAQSGRFEIIRCRYCGSRATHRRCASLKNYESSWACSDCVAAIEGKLSPLPNHVRSPLSERQNRRSIIKRCLANLHPGLLTKRHCMGNTQGEHMADLATQLSQGQQVTLVHVEDGDVVAAALGVLRRSDFDPRHSLSVIFSPNRQLAGAGNLRRFLRLLLNGLQRSKVFIGAEKAKNLALNSQALREDLYFEVGSLLALCLVHGALRLGFFSTALYHSLFGFPGNHQLSAHDLGDTPLAHKVNRIMESSSVKELREAAAAASEYLEAAGCQREINSLSDKDALVEDLVNFYLIIRMQMPLQRFRAGLQTLGVFDRVQICPDVFFPVFCEPPERLNADTMAELFLPQHSEEEEQRAKELTTIAFWKQYLHDCEDGRCASPLEDVLIFATAADAVPVTGFQPTPTLCFLHTAESSGVVPQSQPDTNCLSLPVLPSYQAFKKHMEYAVCQLSVLDGD